MRVVISFVLILAPMFLAAQAVTIAKRGEGEVSVIVKPADASPAQNYAATELQKFVKEITGRELTITTDAAELPPHAILLGNTRHTAAILGTPVKMAELGDEGFRIVTRPPHLLIIGSAARGTLYGVYEVLERFGGCRWYSSWFSVIPPSDALIIPTIDETQTPAFAMREPYWYDMFNGDLAARNKANGNGMRLTAKHGGKGDRFGAGMFVHTFNRLCPPDEFFDTHPEYFSEIDGKRRKEHSQLCLTNPDVLQIVTERLLKIIRTDPQAKLFSVSQNDWHNFCTCPACKAIDDIEGSHAGTMIAFVNQVAEAVEKEFPHVWIETLAYQYTRTPPRTVRPRHNVVPRLCTIECDFSLPLDVSEYNENKRFVEDIRGWSEISKTLYIWDYVTNFRGYITPFPNVKALQRNVQFFLENKVVGLFEQGAYQGRHADLAELKAWLLAKWLWNPELPSKQLMNDFCNGYYGQAAPFVKRYINEVHSFYGVTTNAPLTIYYDVRQKIIPDSFYEHAVKLWQEAEEAVKDDPPRAYNVRMGAVPALHAHLARQPNLDAKAVWVVEDPTNYEKPAFVRQLATTLLERHREAKDMRLSESLERSKDLAGVWQLILDEKPPPGRAKLNADIEDTLFALVRRGQWGDTAKDPLAEDGSAMQLFNTHYEWCASFRMSRVAFDAGKCYRLRMRARVEKNPGRDGEAFWAGIYDPEKKRGCGQITRNTKDVGDDYEWYTISDWQPEPHHYFWVGPGRFDNKTFTANPALKALYIDKLEISRIE